MKILRIYRRLPPNPGGMENHIKQLTEEQFRLGHEVQVAFQSGVPINVKDIKLFDLDFKPRAICILFFYFRIFLKLIFMKNSTKYDVIHIHGDWLDFLIGSVFTRRFSHKMCASIHDGLKKNRLSDFIYYRVLARYDHIFCTGKLDSNYLNSLGVKNVTWQHSGIDSIEEGKINSYKTKHLRPYDVITICSITKVKNVELTVEIASRMPHLEFLILGDGPEMKSIKKMIKARSLRNITLLGNCEKQEVYSYLKDARVYLLTSYNEGTPTSMLEALYFGVPVVVSNSNDYSLIVDKSYKGRIVNDFEPESFVCSIDDVLSSTDSAKRDKISNESSKITWNHVAKNITNKMEAL